MLLFPALLVSAIAGQDTCRFGDTDVAACLLVEGTVALNSDTVWPAALKPMAINKLVIDSRSIPVFDSRVHVRSLVISGPFETRTLANVDANEVTIRNATGTIAFDGTVYDGIDIYGSRVEVKGVRSTKLVYFYLRESELTGDFSSLNTVSLLDINDARVDAARVFPGLSNAGSLNIQESRLEKIALPIISADRVWVNNVQGLSEISFPKLESVGSYFQVNGEAPVGSVAVPNLDRAGSFYISSPVQRIVLKTTLAWGEESFFNASNFCSEYYPGFLRENRAFSHETKC